MSGESPAAPKAHWLQKSPRRQNSSRVEPMCFIRWQPTGGTLVLTALLWLLPGMQASSGSPLSTGAERVTRAATFEVVILKPEHDPVTYEKPLPLELLPYSARSDSYLSVGTAFCIGRNQYLSAAHVLWTSIGSQYGPPVLRDRQGRTYEIDQILKYSMHEDFVVFSLVKQPDVKPLAVSLSGSVNRTVHAVGNALGDGIVIRDGLFTSETPEQQDGRWKWIRFSAAASPGTSGGPLLDERGRVIGVVLAASPSENLNYALPIGRVLSAPDGRARIETRGSFRLPIMPMSITTNFKEEMPLPKNWNEFSQELLGLFNRHIDGARAELLKTYADNFFPNGEDAVQLLHSLHWAITPRLIIKGDDGHWVAEKLSNETTTSLPKNGSIIAGAIAGAQILNLQKPDDVTVSNLFDDSRLYMDLMLKALKFSRTIDSESIKITSLGRSQQEREYIDAYKRKWQLRTWLMPFNDVALISLALPLPTGCAALMRVVSSGLVYQNIEELKVLADLIYVTYTGTLGEWREFLPLKSLHPEVFSRLDIAFEYDKFFRYKSPRLEFSMTPFLQNITAKSNFNLKFSYFMDNSAPTWDVAGLSLKEAVDGNVYVDLLRRPRPHQSLGENFQKNWRKLIKREFPYHSHAYSGDRMTMIGTAATASAASAAPSAPIDPSSKVVYEVNYVVSDHMTDAEMRSLQRIVFEGLKILEQ